MIAHLATTIATPPGRRAVLLTLVAFGGLVFLLGSTGLFAALTDTARTGTNSVDSGALAASADLQLAAATLQDDGSVTCGAFSEDLTSALITASDVGPAWQHIEVICIQNVGSQEVVLHGFADELMDLDTACTGDEDLHGDTTCGDGQAGELSSNLYVAYDVVNCSSFSAGAGVWGPLSDNVTTPAPMGSLAPGSRGCYGVGVFYSADVAVEAVQRAQTDTVTWRYKFTGDAS